MCGIAGMTGRKAKLLQTMLGTIKHRGPDGEGQFSDDHFSLGMRRLAIIDPEGGKQPIWNEDRTVCIFFNGEIYNYHSIWQELQDLGHKFSTNHSDTETIVHGYEQWGFDVLKKLRGMFAFAIYDLKQKKIFIARDRLGIKPLYYTSIGKDFYFASEIKALLEVPEQKRELNRKVAYEYLYYRVHDSGPETFFAGIHRLLPGHYMVVDVQGRIEKTSKYWEPEVNLEFSSKKSDQDYAQELRELYIETIRLHLTSDVPVGISLSGGLDSTGVVSIVNKLIKERGETTHTQKVLTFSAVYPDDPMDETPWIDEVIKYTGAERHLVTPTADHLWEEMDDWLFTQEEPTISSGPYANYNVMREAAKYVKVMLSGQGGDELFAGYIPYFSSYITSALDARKYFPLLRELAQGSDLYFNYFTQLLRSKFYARNIIGTKELIDRSAFPEKGFGYKIDRNLNKRLFNDVTQYSIPNLLRYEDRNSMAFSVEGRVPFLDHVLVEYIFKLPIDQKIKHGWNRYIYRNALRGLIPDKILNRRKKIGFTTPETNWLRRKSESIGAVFASPAFQSNPLFNGKEVKDLYWAWVEDRLRADALVFWRVLNLHLWSQRFKVNL
jgi:asparagine synthase (glutamine-hydrolysing)